MENIKEILKPVYQQVLDHTVPHTLPRWLFAAFLECLLFMRIIILQGWYLVPYIMGLYQLDMFVRFLSPVVDPLLRVDGLELPMTIEDEFRPFIRRLPEFKFWVSTVRSTLVAVICTFFESLNIPVFWPIPVIIFCVFFCYKMKQQVLHMMKHHYVPLTRSKPKYGSFH